MNRKMVFEFRGGSHLRGDAQKVGETLRQIERKNGLMTADLALEHARKKTSPLHPYAEWDDSKAAHEYRLEQMRHVIRSVVVIRSETTEPMRAFHHVSVTTGDATSKGYANVDRAAADERMRDQIIKDLRWRANQWANQARQFEEFSDIVAAVDKAA